MWLASSFRSAVSVCVYALLTASLSTFAWGEQPYPVTTNLLADGPVFSPNIEYFEDTEGKLTADRLTDAESQVLWRQIPANSANFGFRQTIFWFRLSLANPFDSDVSRLIVIKAPHLDDIRFFTVRPDRSTQFVIKTGESTPYSQRLIENPYYIFPISLASDSAAQFLFRVESGGNMTFPMEIWEERPFFVNNSGQAQAYASYYGFLIFLIIFNSFIFISLRESTHFFYVLLTSMILLVQASLHGKTFEYLWPNTPSLQNLSILLGVPLIVFSASEFSRRFLNLSQTAPRLNPMLLTMSGLGLINLFTALLLPPHVSKNISVSLVLVFAFILFCIGPYLWSRGHHSARLFTCAWLSLLIGGVTTVLMRFGLLPVNQFTFYSFEIGSAIEAILLSVAIVDRVYFERNMRLEAQQIIIEEQSRRRRLEEKRLHEATHSVITNLPNRSYLERFISDRIEEFPELPFHLCLVRMKRFRAIDRTLGHVNADELLQRVAEDLANHVQTISGIIPLEKRESDNVLTASLSFDTFIALMDFRDQIAEDPSILSILQFLRKRVEYERLTLNLDPRIGIATYPNHATSTDSLLRKAHIAMDSTGGSNGHIIEYNKELDPYSERRLTLMAELDKALESDGLELNFQPQLDLDAGRICSLEVLVRWLHPVHGNIPPAEFIPLAEKTGVIRRLTRWVLESAVARVAYLADAGFPDISLSINISVVDLTDTEFPSFVRELLDKHNIKPGLLTLEITETSLMSDPLTALGAMDTLRTAGLHLALDDFGTGYSSLSYIKQLPLDEIKIDRSLVADMGDSEDGKVIVKTAMDMSHSLGYRVVAEGLEDEDLLEMLRNMQCDRIQGYWLARPMPWELLLEWLKTYKQSKQQAS